MEELREGEMMFLSPDELQELTGKTRRPSQASVLNAMGIPHKIRPDGAVLVLKSAIETTPRKYTKHFEPDYGAINA